MDLAQELKRLVKTEIKASLHPPEIGTITESGLQLEGTLFPIPTWWGAPGASYPPGTKVLVVPLKGGSEFWVSGPVEEKGVGA